MEQFKPNLKYSIKTPTGFQKFGGIRKLDKSKHYVIRLSNGKTVKCSDNHPFIKSGKEIFAHQLSVGTELDSEESLVSVQSIKLVEESIDLYDIVEVDNGNIFNVDGIVSHNCDFITSGHTVVEGEILEWYKTTHVEDPVEKRGHDQGFWVWEYPDYSKDYMVVADVARGDSKDYSAFHVLDVESLKQVASYKGQPGTKEYGNMLVNVATEWNNALLVVENANVGWASIQVAIDRNYQNLYYTYKNDGYQDPDIYYQKGYDLKDKSQMVPGFTTSTRTRPLIVSKLETVMRERTPIIKDTRLIQELFVFVWNGSKAEARQGYNDDLVMSWAIALWVRDTALKLRQQGIELTKSTLNGITRNTSIYTNQTGQLKDSGWTMKTKDGDMDTRWLL
jgi:hypothetical protein